VCLVRGKRGGWVPVGDTEAGWQKVRQAAPGHGDHVIDALTPDQITRLADITQAIVHRLDPDASRAGMYRWYDSLD
jgi:hypothetical protein